MNKIDGLKHWKKQFPEDYEDARRQYKLNEICIKMGWDSPIYPKLNTEEFIERAKKVHGDKYDYSMVEYVNAHTKVKIICPIHGEFEQMPNPHFNGSGCLKCSGSYKMSTEELISKAKEVHGNKYDYSLVEYKDSKTKIKIKCPIHGVFEQIPRTHLKGTGCMECKKTLIW